MTSSPTSTGWTDGLLTDLYQLTMAQAYLREEMTDEAVFSLFVRRLPKTRNFLVACGLETVLDFIASVRFGDDSLEYLASLDLFESGFLDWLSDFSFTGEIRAVDEGTPVFANEPLLEVRGPIAEAQLLETFVMNQMHLQTLLASKAARVVLAAQGRTVVDFGLRRTHGIDAGLKAARAFWIAGVDATSNVLAGRVYGIPVTGTMAHSYIQAHDEETVAFQRFVELYPGTILLVDTYDTVEGVRRVAELLAEQTGEAEGVAMGYGDNRVSGVRLDSGDLHALSKASREVLDAAGLTGLKIFASGGLDEYTIDKLLASGAPIDGFGVGTAMGVSADAPALDIAYKLAEYGGKGRLKLSPGKPILPGPKQVFRFEADGSAQGDVIAAADEALGGRPLLKTVWRSGQRVGESPSLHDSRELARRAIQSLPDSLRQAAPAPSPYSVEVSETLTARQAALVERMQTRF